MWPPCQIGHCRCFPIPEGMGRPAAGLGDDGTRHDRVRTVKVHARHSIASELLKNNRVVTSADLPTVEGFGKAKSTKPGLLAEIRARLVSFAGDVWPTPWSVPPGFPIPDPTHDYSLGNQRTNRQTVSRGKSSSIAQALSLAGDRPDARWTPSGRARLGSVLTGSG